MKKTWMLIASGLFLVVLISSCGGRKPNLLTEEQVNQKIDSLYNAQAPQISQEADQACELKLESLVSQAVDSIMTANASEVQ
ncbi:MAG TPA: hypothetical protein PKC40_02340 [Saprospiraceae bacterium]|nr:hypothetical protein [Saprospiraceae bacterium]